MRSCLADQASDAVLARAVGLDHASLEEVPKVADDLHHVACRLDLPVQIDVLRTLLHQIQQLLLSPELR